MTDLHKDAIVIDGLIISNWSRAVFEDMKRGGLTAANCTCSVWDGFKGTMENIAQWKLNSLLLVCIVESVTMLDDVGRWCFLLFAAHFSH